MVFCNENFVVMAKLVAQSGGVSDLPLMIFPWNNDVLPEEELRQLTDKAFTEVVAALTKAN